MFVSHCLNVNKKVPMDGQVQSSFTKVLWFEVVPSSKYVMISLYKSIKHLKSERKA